METGAQVHILPEVHHEVLRGLGRIERQRVKRRHKDIHGEKRAKRLSAQSAAVEEAATRWHVSELERTDSPLHPTGMSEGDAEEVEKEASGFKQSSNGFERLLWDVKEYYKRDYRFQEI